MSPTQWAACKTVLTPWTTTTEAPSIMAVKMKNPLFFIPRALTPVDGLEGPTWIFGDPFIRQYCNIYDIGNKRMGFAPSNQNLYRRQFKIVGNVKASNYRIFSSRLFFSLDEKTTLIFGIEYSHHGSFSHWAVFVRKSMNFVSEDVYHIFSTTTTITSFSFNLYLVYILIVTRVNGVGEYRWLLLTFAVVDVVISLVHYITIPAIHMTEFGYIFWGYRFIHFPTAIGSNACIFWAVLFYQTFLLLAYHYFYRFAVLCSPPWIEKMQRNPWRNWLSLAIALYVMFCGSTAALIAAGWSSSDESRAAFGPALQTLYNVDLFEPEKAGHMAIIYWVRNADNEKEWQFHRVKYVAGLILLHVLCGATIVACLVQIVHAMSQTGINNLSPKTRFLQRQLVRALLWQTFFPTVFSYIPIGCIFVLPLLTQYPFGGFGTIALMSTQIFPIIDPFLVLIFIQGYQASLPKIVQRLFIASATSTSVIHISNLSPSQISSTVDGE